MRADERWRNLVPYTLVVAAVLVVSVPLMTVFTLPVGSPLHAYVGLMQLLLVTVVRFPWQVTVAARMLRISPTTAGIWEATPAGRRW
jgi:cytochrome b